MLLILQLLIGIALILLLIMGEIKYENKQIDQFSFRIFYYC